MTSNPTSTEAAALVTILREISIGRIIDYDRIGQALAAYDASLRAHANAASHSPSAASVCEQPAVWRVTLSCCGMENGHYDFPTWDAADAYRMQYEKTGVPYSAPTDESGHRRAGVISKIDPSEQPADAGVGPVAWMGCNAIAALRLGWNGIVWPTEEGCLEHAVAGGKGKPMPLYAAPPAIPHADEGNARNARSVGTGAVTDLPGLLDALRRQKQCDEDGVMCEVSRQAVDEAIALIESFAAHHAQPSAESARPQASGARDMFARDNARMRKAGCALAEAAMFVVREFDGVHRLALAVADWSKAIADEGDRATIAQQSARSHPSEGDGNAREGKS